MSLISPFVSVFHTVKNNFQLLACMQVNIVSIIMFWVVCMIIQLVIAHVLDSTNVMVQWLISAVVTMMVVIVLMSVE